MAKQKETATLKGHGNTVNALAFSPDGKLLATGSQDRTVKLWELPSGELRDSLEGHEDVVWSVADPDALDVKARGEAISKARQIVDEMAKSLGGRVGGLLYVSNGEPYGSYFRAGGGFGNGNLQTVEVSATKLPILNLFPQKVRREVTIYAVFALE